MARVKEVVDYAIDLDMYVILDTHHETNFWLKSHTFYDEAIASAYTDRYKK